MIQPDLHSYIDFTDYGARYFNYAGTIILKITTVFQHDS